jgi:menaquinone-dependent protoporphyrinogen oxidase
MGRVLVAYSCYFGRTRELVGELAQRLRARGHDVDVANAREGRLPPPQDYDAVVLGSPVHHGHHARVILDYAREYHDALEAMPTEFFSVTLATTPLVEAWKLADLVTVALAEQPVNELSPVYGPI